MSGDAIKEENRRLRLKNASLALSITKMAGQLEFLAEIFPKNESTQQIRDMMLRISKEALDKVPIEDVGAGLEYC